MKKHHFIGIVLLAFISCKNDEIIEQITHPNDYNSFLFTSNNKTFTSAFSEKEFWSKRLRPDTTGIGDLGPLARAYSTLFESTGDIFYLKSAEKLYNKAIIISAHSKDSYIRSLAYNYITQHRFKEAKVLLEDSYAGLSNKRATEFILFDVYMELGEFIKADELLGKLKNTNDYNYLIRLSKWNDHHGNLDAAIRNLEQAKEIADSRKSKTLQIWTYSNLADFYGHSGRIKESYHLYLKTLQLQPDNAYAKKRIAWIVYSIEKNTKEANRILDSVMISHKAPDYYLFKAKMAEFDGDISERDDQTNNFINTVSSGNYGSMYNKYLIELYLETLPEKALEIANKELESRSTPQIYHLQALALLKTGNKEEALEVIANKVEDKTFEPLALYHSAIIYRANGLDKKVKKLKKELVIASFELGPVITLKVDDL